MSFLGRATPKKKFKMIRIGIICPSEIAFRRFLPALNKTLGYSFVGIAYANAEEWFGNNLPNVTVEVVSKVLKGEEKKAKQVVDNYGGRIFSSYISIIESNDIDAIYLPLPPGLHYKWARLALEYNKHIFLEKPSTTSLLNTNDLINIGRKRDLAIHENYMFMLHDQIKAIDKIIENGEIGDIRLYRISFGFPRRDVNDFRYNKNLGGGALMDCGGYTLKYASMLLGESARIVDARLNYINDFDVDIYGSGTLINDKEITAQISFGMDNSYKCDLEVWGSHGTLFTGRVFTAPDGFVSTVTINNGKGTEIRDLPADDTFMKSIKIFQQCILDNSIKNNNYSQILKQAKLVDDFKRIANK